MAVPSPTIQLGGLALDLDQNKLQLVFQQYGQVQQCQLFDAFPGAPGKAAVLTMGTEAEATWLVTNVNNNIPQGLETPITVQYYSAAPAVDMSSFAGYAAPAPAPFAMPAGGLNLAAALNLPAAGFAGGFGGAMAPAMSGSFQTGTPQTGTVKRWDDVKGFGFIVPDGGGSDVFVHVGDLPEGHVLVNGGKVVFEAVEEDTTKGPAPGGGPRYRAKSCSGGVPKETVAAATPSATGATTDNLFVTGLPADTSEDMIRNVFSQYGRLQSMKKLPVQPGKPDCACLIRMGSPDEAAWLVTNLHGNIPTGLTTPVNVKFAENKGAQRPRAAPY